MKRNPSIIFYILVISAIILDWEKWKIADNTTILALGFVGYFVISLLAVWFVWCGVLMIKNVKKSKKHIVLLLIIMVFVLGSFTFIPVSDAGIKANHIFNKSSREIAIELLSRDELTPLSPDSYNLPSICRLTSHTGKIYVESNEKHSGNIDKVMFYVHCGTNKSSAIIYSAKDTPVKNGDFGHDEYTNIKKLEPNWYYCVSK